MRRAVAAVVVTFGVAAGPVWGAVVDCLVTPSAMVKLVFPVSGLLALVEVQRGQVVGKGEVVARLDSSVETAGLDIARARAEAHAGIEAARARLASADRQLARVAGLAAKALVPQTEADAARLERDQAANELRDRQEMQVTARLEAERAARLVDQRILISPIAGVVVDIEVIAPSEAFGKVALGDFIDVTLERPAGAHKAAQVAVLDPFVDAASGTFRIRLTLPNPKGDITAGFRCQAELP